MKLQISCSNHYVKIPSISSVTDILEVGVNQLFILIAPRLNPESNTMIKNSPKIEVIGHFPMRNQDHTSQPGTQKTIQSETFP